MRMEFNGSFPDDYRWANQTQITETILPMDSGMCPTGTVLTFHPLERRPTDSDFTGDQCVTDFY